MARVLCAWEFGGDLGHVRRLLPIAAELRLLGHEAIFAFRDSFHLDAVHARGFDGFVAPLLRAPTAVNPSPISHSDILLNLGFDDRHALAGALRAWHSLLDLVRPDLLLADYAPTALVAARAAGLPRATIGSGFSLPLDRDPLPALRPWLPSDEGVLRAIDARLVNAIRAAMNGAQESISLARDIFDAQAHLLCTFAELDPFGPREGASYLGPNADAVGGVDVRWQGESGPRVFAYLKPRGPRFAALLAGLRGCGAEVIVAAPGLPATEALAASAGSMRVVPDAVNLDPILAQASLCVSHAGPGLAARALIAGIPMALLPMQLEQFLVARQLAGGGNAVLVSPEEPLPELTPWFEGLLARDDLRVAARERAGAYRGYSFGDAARRAARRVAEVAGA